jgi:hypothetical protein
MMHNYVIIVCEIGTHYFCSTREKIPTLKGLGHEIEFKYLDKKEEPLLRKNKYWRDIY